MIEGNMFQYTLLSLYLLMYGNVDGNIVSSCGHTEVSCSYLDAALDMISKAKTSCSNVKHLRGGPLDCADLLFMGYNKSGVYAVRPMNRLTEGKIINVYCDMDTNGGGWTVIQRRGDFQRPIDYFFKDWKSYKEGFGDLAKDFWLGNDYIFALTNQKQYSARFDLKDVESEKRFALYDSFWIDDEFNKYTLHIAEYSGDAGDSMTAQHNNIKFSTKDQENDNQKDDNCAEKYKGGWWYHACHSANLNGLYLKGPHESFADGVVWLTWKGFHDSLLSTEIKIRPKNFHSSFFSTPSG